MQDPNDLQNDPLDAALGAIDRQPAGDALRAAVLAQTIGAIRHHRRAKRCALAAGLLACYLAGITTMGVWRSGGQHESSMAKRPAPTAQPHRLAPRAIAPDRTQVAVAKLSGFESWRRIGDHYLQDTGDISLAVAGYSQAIDLASDEERAISPERDNWLLMALKDARAKEKKHAHVEPN